MAFGWREKIRVSEFFDAWDGVGNRESRCPEDDIADFAKNYDWQRVIGMIEDNPKLANAWRPNGESFFTPLHQVRLSDT